MGIDARDELAVLRARAYGPDADIAEDPEALARLRELEDGHIGPAAPPTSPEHASSDREPPPDADVPRPEGTTEHDDPHELGPGVRAVPEEEPSTEEGHPRTRRRRVALMWTASVIVAAMVSAAVAVFATRQFQDDTGGVATLGADTEFVWPRAFGGPERAGDAYEVFHGIRPLTTDDARRTGASDECLFLLSDDLIDDSDYYSGSIWGSGCGAGAFPAVVAMKVTAGMPEELRARFPIGTSLQFTLVDGEISVQRAWGPVSYFGDPDPAETR